MKRNTLTACTILAASLYACKTSQNYESAQAVICQEKNDSATYANGRTVTILNLINGKSVRTRLLYRKMINNALYIGIDKDAATRLQMQYTGLAPVEIRN